MALQLPADGKSIEDPVELGQNLNTSSLSMSAPKLIVASVATISDKPAASVAGGSDLLPDSESGSSEYKQLLEAR